MSITSTLDKADAEIVAAVKKLHITTQVARFLRLAVFAFLAQLPTVEAAFGTKAVGWSAIAAVVVGALETGFRQAFPSFRLDATASVVTSAVKEQATGIATSAVNTLITDAKARQAQVETLLSGLATQAKAEAVKLDVPLAIPDAVPPAPVTFIVGGSVLSEADLSAAAAKAFTPPAAPTAS